MPQLYSCSGRLFRPATNGHTPMLDIDWPSDDFRYSPGYCDTYSSAICSYDKRSKSLGVLPLPTTGRRRVHQPPRLTRSLYFSKKSHLHLPRILTAQQLDDFDLETFSQNHFSLLPLITYHSPSALLELRYPFSCFSDNFARCDGLSSFQSSWPLVEFPSRNADLQDPTCIFDARRDGLELSHDIPRPASSHRSSKGISTLIRLSQFPKPPGYTFHGFTQRFVDRSLGDNFTVEVLSPGDYKHFHPSGAVGSGVPKDAGIEQSESGHVRRDSHQTPVEGQFPLVECETPVQYRVRDLPSDYMENYTYPPSRTKHCQRLADSTTF